jgi:hypothetical protein
MLDQDPLADLPVYLRAAKVAAILDVSEQLLSDWRKAKIGPPYVKLTAGRAGAVRYPREGLRAYLTANTVDPRSLDPERYCADCGALGIGSGHSCQAAVTA